MQNFSKRFTPYLVMGIVIVMAIAGLFLLSYLLIWGALVALVLYAVAWIRAKFFQKPAPTRKGRTIDYKEL